MHDTVTGQVEVLGVVDDEKAVRSSWNRYLSGHGFDVTTAKDGGRAISDLAERPADVVVSDLKMPGMSGERLHDEMRRARPELAADLLLTTGDTVSREGDEVARRTGVELLHKPFDLAQLCRRVREKLATRGA